MNTVTKHCLFCGEGERLRDLYPQTFTAGDLTPAVFSARRPTEHFHYRIVRCTACGLVFAREILPDDQLAALYARSAVTFTEHTGVIRRDYWRCLQPFLDGVARDSALEVGCSTGFFLEELRDRGFANVRGVEPSTEARARAAPHVREWITPQVFTRGMFPPASFGLLCSFQTLDHLSDPAGAVAAAYEILRPGGLAYCITHDVDALQARVLGKRSPIFDVEHVYLFNRSTLRRLFREHGFDVLSVGSVANSYPLRYWVAMFPLPAGVRKGVAAAVTFLRLGGLSAPLRAGNIFIIARKPS